MAADQHPLERAIAAQEALRGTVPDDVVDAAVAASDSSSPNSMRHQPRRRQVTVLFADVSGFTAMSEQMDPELLSQRMNEIWARLDAVVSAHGGHVDKHIGDAMMALWGAEALGRMIPSRQSGQASPCRRNCGDDRRHRFASGHARGDQHGPGASRRSRHFHRIHGDGRHGERREQARTPGSRERSADLP
jgi:class 3 adenylate cyclase